MTAISDLGVRLVIFNLLMYVLNVLMGDSEVSRYHCFRVFAKYLMKSVLSIIQNNAF